MKVWELWLCRKPFKSYTFGNEQQIGITDENWDYVIGKYGFREFMMPEGYEKYGIMKDNSKIIEVAFNQFLYERKQGIDKVVDAFFMTYNPIENTDRFEDITDVTTNAGTDTTTISTLKNTTDNRKTDMTDTPNISTSTTDSKSVYGYNDNNTASPSEKSEVVNNENGNRVTTTINSGGLDDSEETETINEKGTSIEFKHTNHTHGNIGVTTNAQMLDGEFEIRKKNLIDSIFYDFFQTCSYVGW